ncbi:Regulator of microtubule dynamics protein [Phytophthora cinnamomi]|uniref:Regulator of microtubule dynamics protein n=1 Tax=Phytophthora cinnamomi TaxID=4785 RepID=UPI003559914E|nr:Regulator of microtubule dynamics protein [Phytophthora cinnamomi]
MTPNYRGWLWSLVAVAGTATAAVVVYKLATRGVRDHGEGEAHAAAETEDADDVDYEWLSEDEADEADASEQQLLAVDRGRNMLLAVFGLMLMVLVTVVSLVISWNSEDEELSFVGLPMFQPLMWVAVGIFTAASMELFTRSSTLTPEVPVLEEKAVFPHDARDFELIRQHDGSAPSSVTKADGQQASRPARTENSDEEEKSSIPGDIESIITRADELFEQGHHAQTREYLKDELSKYPPSVEMLWRLARACNYLVDEKSSPDEKKALAFEGLADAEKAYALNSDSAASNKWMAIMTSTMGNFRDLKEKIAGAYVIRDHIQRAIELDPTDATSHNILGQWCLAFADMTWIEKRAAAALFGTPPTATYEEAVQHFQAAEKISPGFWKKNVFLLAQTYMKMKRTKEAASWVLKAKAVPVKTKEDEEVAQDIAALMKQLKLS